MSIPSYQFASLGAENIAKKRVMRKAQKGVETEEQRAVKSGKVADSIKNVYRSIIANLEMQKTTISIATAFIKTMVYSTLDPEEEEAPQERELISFLIASLGKLVGLANQLSVLIGGLRDEIIKSGNPANPSIDVARIVALMDEVDKLYGQWGISGLSKAFAEMVESLEASGQYPPQLDGLLEIWEVANSDARETLNKIQSNAYQADLQSVNIPTKSTDARRLQGIREGSERRDFTRAEYEGMIKARKRGDKFTQLRRTGEERALTGKERALMEELRRQGLLSGDDFTSVYQGRSDDSTIGTDYSNAGFGYDSDSGGESDSGMYINYGDSDDDTDYSGAGLYTIHPPVRRPAYDFPPFARPLSSY